MALLSVPALVRRWRSDPTERARVVLVACWGGLHLALALWQRRFVYYAVVPLSVLSWEALAFGAGRLMARFAPGRQRWAPVLAWVGAAAVALPSAVRIPEIFASSPPDTIEALRWLGFQRPSTDGHEGVMANWNLGHLIRYYAGKPVVASPFGTDGGREALLDEARFATAATSREAEAATTPKILIPSVPPVSWMSRNPSSGGPGRPGADRPSWNQSRLALGLRIDVDLAHGG